MCKNIIYEVGLKWYVIVTSLVFSIQSQNAIDLLTVHRNFLYLLLYFSSVLICVSRSSYGSVYDNICARFPVRVICLLVFRSVRICKVIWFAFDSTVLSRGVVYKLTSKTTNMSYPGYPSYPPQVIVLFTSTFDLILGYSKSVGNVF